MIAEKRILRVRMRAVSASFRSIAAGRHAASLPNQRSVEP
jgi:hypothetical protein